MSGSNGKAASTASTAAPRSGPPNNTAAPRSGPPSNGVTPPSTDAVVANPDDPIGHASPAEVLELAAACVRFVATQVKIEPDFTPETMSLVDHYVAGARQAIAQRPETLPLTAHAVGAYMGEVAKRQHPCWWRVDVNDPGAWRLEFGPVLLSFYPIQVAYSLLTPGIEEEAFSGFEMRDADREVVVARLSELPPVSEDEYYSPTARLEALDIAVDALIAAQLADPFAKRGYRPEDYL